MTELLNVKINSAHPTREHRRFFHAFRSTFRSTASAAALLALQACAWAPHAENTRDTRADAAHFLLFGEQHDQVDHQAQVARTITERAKQHKLHTVVIEMAERGHSTAGLPTNAPENEVQQRLHWHETGWPWSHYGPVVMAAVHAGLSVVGGNLPKAEQKIAAQESRLDHQVTPEVHALIAEAVSTSHCRLLPPEAVTRMVRIQIARDDTMAQTLMAEALHGPVLLLAGEQHVARDRGVPQHLLRRGISAAEIHSVGFNDSDVTLDERRPARVTPRTDPCAE